MFGNAQHPVLVAKVETGTNLHKVKDKIEQLAGYHFGANVIKAVASRHDPAKFVLVFGSQDTLESFFKCKFERVEKTVARGEDNSYRILRWKTVIDPEVSSMLKNAGVTVIELQESVTAVKGAD